MRLIWRITYEPDTHDCFAVFVLLLSRHLDCNKVSGSRVDRQIWNGATPGIARVQMVLTVSVTAVLTVTNSLSPASGGFYTTDPSMF